MKYSVYVLIKDKCPIYVGVTTNIKNRIARHRIDKLFDGYLIIEEYHKKEDAFTAERSIIKFMSITKSEKVLNGFYVRFNIEQVILKIK
jgi:predicted GIY-YIG superfamily endonuclease